jgi:hypothetical protein
MGAVGAKCMKGCEGGKNEVGEENLEDIHNDQKQEFLNQPIKIEDDKSENIHTNKIYKARSANKNSSDIERECKF